MSQPQVLAGVVPTQVSEDVRRWFREEPRWWLRAPMFRDPRGHIDGVPLAAIVEHLRHVYDEQAVRRLIDDGYWAFLLGLYSGATYLESMGNMLALGLDLVAAPEVLDDPEILRHLRYGEHFPGARLEVGCWAGLRRGGLLPRRPDLAGKKQPDFIVDVDGTEFAIECKSLSNGNEVTNQKMLTWVFEGRVGPALMNCLPCDALLVVSDEAHALFATPVKAFQETFVPEFEAALASTLAKPAIDSVPRAVGRFGTLTLQLTTDGSRTLEVEHMTHAGHREGRVLQMFESAATKFVHVAATCYRVAVVQTADGYVDAASVAARLHRACRAAGAPPCAFNAGMVLTFSDRGFEPGWTLERGTFYANDAKAPPTASVFDALAAWKRHACPPNDLAGTRYHEVFAANARLRAGVTALGPGAPCLAAPSPRTHVANRAPTARSRSHRRHRACRGPSSCAACSDRTSSVKRSDP